MIRITKELAYTVELAEASTGAECARRLVERAGFRVLYTRTKWCRRWD